jgi:phospholipid transport system transporter-binding protein
VTEQIEEDNDLERLFRLSGELTFATVEQWLMAFSQRLATQTLPTIIDLGEVTRTDSAGLALLIEMRKQVKEAPLIFRQMPAQMLKLATVSGVEELLLQSQLPSS